MQIIEPNEFTAKCRGRNGKIETVNMMLIGRQEKGTWIVNFLGSAREILSEDEAKKINLAFDALEKIAENNAENIDIESYFPKDT